MNNTNSSIIAVVIAIIAILAIFMIIQDDSFVSKEFEKCPTEDLKSCFNCCAQIDSPFEVAEFDKQQCFDKCSIEILKD